MTKQHYADRKNEELGEHFAKHLFAISSENLGGKLAIASELAWRDIQIEQLTKQVERMNPFNQPPINRHSEYAKAVITLIKMANQDCGGSARCAQVLLSLYNGDEWHVDLADVACSLDEKHTNAALTAIRYRGELMTEPHQVIENGAKVFDELWQQWGSLHVEKRYKRYY